MKNKFIGLDIGGTNIKIAVIDTDGKIATKHIELINKSCAEKIISQIIEIIEHTVTQENDVASIGIGLPGIIDSKTSIMIQSPNLPLLEDINLKDILYNKFKVPVYIDNDVNVAAYAEYKLNPEIVKNNFKNIIFLAAGTGLGGGIILNGEIWKGSSGFAGELGHICIDINGDNCNCGGKGCIETYVSSTGLIKRLKKHIWRFPNSSLSRIAIEKINPEDIFEAARNNDAIAAYVLNEFIEALAAGIGSLINIFNPQAVVLGGGILIPNPHITEAAAKRAKNYSFRKPYQECIIVLSYLKNEAGVIGSALSAKNLIDTVNINS